VLSEGEDFQRCIGTSEEENAGSGEKGLMKTVTNKPQ